MSAAKNENYRAAERGIERYELSSGAKRYRVRFNGAQGKHRSKSFSRLADARSFHSEIRRQIETGQTTRAASPRLTLADFAFNVWLPEAKRVLAPATWDRDKLIYNKHILNQLGPRRIAQLDPEDLLDWRNQLQDEGVGSATIIRALSILSSIFQAAQMRGKSTGVTTNPTRIIPKPRVKTNRAVRVYPLAAVEMVRWLMVERSSRIGPQAHQYAIQDAAFLSLMLQTGARPGEIMALRWDDIGREAIIIDKSVDKDGVKATKTGGSRRIEILETLRADLDGLRSNSISSSQYVITTKDGDHWGIPDRNNWRRRHFGRASKEAERIWSQLSEEGKLDSDWPRSIEGIAQATPYHLGRHTHSALMLSVGMPLIQLSAIQGHNIRTLSEVYAHNLDSVDPNGDPAEQIASARDSVKALLHDFTEEAIRARAAKKVATKRPRKTRA